MSHNIYYNPEKFGLTTVGEIELSSGSYEFDTIVLWKQNDGGFVWDHDSGCSCPSPFEGSSLESVSRGSLNDFRAYVKSQIDAPHRGDYGPSVNSLNEDLQNVTRRALDLISA